MTAPGRRPTPTRPRSAPRGKTVRPGPCHSPAPEDVPRPGRPRVPGVGGRGEGGGGAPTGGEGGAHDEEHAHGDPLQGGRQQPVPPQHGVHQLVLQRDQQQDEHRVEHGQPGGRELEGRRTPPLTPHSTAGVTPAVRTGRPSSELMPAGQTRLGAAPASRGGTEPRPFLFSCALQGGSDGNVYYGSTDVSQSSNDPGPSRRAPVPNVNPSSHKAFSSRQAPPLTSCPRWARGTHLPLTV